ncbi:hypothetical protein A2V49_03390 [candidate division WWE3 bacterium RBG_19FT_COMBO_34_6]|uniref:Uncharacterized protein n=1 Tax=candidate division WWE3 bacterium RBG_19FT_COMBO_34_6 TaxID=1802612 RepID=A0A1F4UKH3_UNCKA|nr:MAG: hypothetical protein A2V49_03390 [candidate division WWE3 bacterium RBG_19FT_COMBO_34_6]
MYCPVAKNKNLLLTNFLLHIFIFIIFLIVSLLLNNKFSKAEKLNDGVWSQSASPGTTTISFANGTTVLQTGFDIVLTFPSTANVDATGTNISVTGQTTPTRTNNDTDNTITITLDGTIDSGLAVTITMTDALTSYTTTTYAQESLAVNTQNSTDVPIDFGLAIKTNDNTTLVSTQVPLFLNIAVDTTNIQLGTLSTASVNEADQTYTVNSNNRTGITVQIDSDGDLDDGFGNTINSVADDTVTAGSEEYGISVDNVANITVESPYDAGDDALPTNPTDIAYTATEISNATFDINYKASITGTTIAGSYDQVVTITISSNA